MTDSELLRAAINASGIVARDGSPNVEGFARRVLGAHDGANARKVLGGTGALGLSSRVLCRLIVMRPSLTRLVQRAAEAATDALDNRARSTTVTTVTSVSGDR